MLTFKEYLFEYTLKHNELNNIVKMKSGSNGKDRNRAHLRKHVNTDPKQYRYSSSDVDSIMNGSANLIPLSKEKLMSVLAEYGVEFKPDTVKVLGNSGVEVHMLSDHTGKLVKRSNVKM